MIEEYKIEDIKRDGFLHTRIYKFSYDHNKRLFEINVGFADLKAGGAIVDCTIIITDWWDFEVIQYRGYKIINKFKGNDVPELDSIIDFTYDGNMLIFEDLCGPDELYQFKFTKPKIQITGEHDPD